MLFIFSCGWFIYFLFLKSLTFQSASILTLKTHTHTHKNESLYALEKYAYS